MNFEYSGDTANKLLFDPIRLGGNRLCILSAYATPSMASWLITTYEEQRIFNISVELIITSTVNEGIDQDTHNGFKDLHGKKNFLCSYLYQPPALTCNSYIWLHDDEPIKAFSCSYDFTQASLLRKHDGFITECSAASAYKKYIETVSRSTYCNLLETEECIIFRSPKMALSTDIPADDENCVHLSLLTRKGETGIRSGLNWGQRNNRNRNEAYILLPRKVAKTGFFPLNKQHFLAVTDDQHTLQLRVEQQNDKAITTPASNAQLGEYFRNRLGLPYGAYVHTTDLKTYGRTDVMFYKIDDEQYYMDFSRPEQKRN